MTVGVQAALKLRGHAHVPLHNTAFQESETKPAITPGLSQYITDLLTSAQIPGISLGVVHASGSDPDTELESWGRKTEDGDGNDLSPDTLFDIASCSKGFLASAVGILMDDFAQGRNVTPLPAGITIFDWETKLVHLLPGEWALEYEWASEKANVRDALSHVTGMPRHDFSYAPGDTPQGIVNNLRNLRPAYELRQKWSYNNQMFMVGAYLVSKYADKPYTEFASERLFEPMNMSTTTFSPNAAREMGLLTQTWTSFGRRIPSGFPDDAVELMAGPGGIISSATDLTKWLAVLLNNGVDPVSNTTIIPSSAFEEITTAYSVMEGTPPSPEMSIWGYGLGWVTFSYQGHNIVAHTGDITGISTLVVFLPDDGLGIAVLTNADDKDDANMAIAIMIIGDLLGLNSVTTNATGTAVSEEGLSTENSSTPAAEPLPVNLESLSGTYSNLGYGNITFCTANDQSPDCPEVLASFAPFINQTSSPELYAAWLRIYSSHVRLTHQSATEFSVQFTSLFPEGYGANTTAFETAESGEIDASAVFVLGGEGENATVFGFGMEIDEDAVAARKRAGARDLEEWADAWFEKLGRRLTCPHESGRADDNKDRPGSRVAFCTPTQRQGRLHTGPWCSQGV
ncbi:hypothetical protein FOMPIDRAFT_114665 [Fomitopsis schrenkii]|uniref:Beta-lactamase-related domain-containing protein n=1 Tax=Fomitopsis schrenkii TaxID=2126942 RepID=S8E7K2_FOMSC|nr:hypothetical protein FOMPIDRAFT_114665 [Fomitopsis schrenkii]